MTNILHVIAMPLAAWRLTELIMQDQISLPIRKKFPGYIWTCYRCLSVWAGAAATLFFVFSPWLNWPFALAWLYLWQQDNRIFRRQLHKRSFVAIVGEGKNLDITRQELTAEELDAIAEILPRVRSQVS
jgi:hypothetical protein